MSITYEEALAVVAGKEAELLGEMTEIFDELKANIESAKLAIDQVKDELPDNNLPSNIRAIVEQYRGQIQSFLDQTNYMSQTTESTLNLYVPPAPLPPLP